MIVNTPKQKMLKDEPVERQAATILATSGVASFLADGMAVAWKVLKGR